MARVYRRLHARIYHHHRIAWRSWAGLRLSVRVAVLPAALRHFRRLDHDGHLPGAFGAVCVEKHGRFKEDRLARHPEHRASSFCALCFMIVIAKPLIQVGLEYGRFNAAATAVTSSMLSTSASAFFFLALYAARQGFLLEARLRKRDDGQRGRGIREHRSQLRARSLHGRRPVWRSLRRSPTRSLPASFSTCA